MNYFELNFKSFLILNKFYINFISFKVIIILFLFSHCPRLGNVAGCLEEFEPETEPEPEPEPRLCPLSCCPFCKHISCTFPACEPRIVTEPKCPVCCKFGCKHGFCALPHCRQRGGGGRGRFGMLRQFPGFSGGRGVRHVTPGPVWRPTPRPMGTRAPAVHVTFSLCKFWHLDFFSF